MNRFYRLILAAVVLPHFIGACATIPSDFRQPGVSVLSVTPRLGQGIAPEFDIVLRVTNPNRRALALEGLTYTIDLAGYPVVDGVASDLPRIEAYGEAEVGLTARADLFRGLGLLADLMRHPEKPLDYEFSAEIDLGGFYPTVRVNRSGTLNFRVD